MRIVLFGPQGSGKGTQAKLLAEALGVPHISTGDLFRAEIAADTDLGRQVSEIVGGGRLVPDGIVLQLLRRRLAEPGCRKGFVLDGCPRNRAQADALEQIAPVDRAVYLQIPEAAAVRRLSSRRQCRGCGRIYGENQKPKVAGRCDACGNELYQRQDDWPDAIRQRFRLFAEETVPVIMRYQERGLLVQVNGEQSVAAVFQQIRQALKLA